MPKQSIRSQIAELERTLKLEQEGVVSFRGQAEYWEQEYKKAKGELNYAKNEIAWYRRVIECLVSPDDNKKAF